MTSSVVGTVRKYQNAFAIKKHNAQVRAWAAPMARDIAVAFWDTWKSIEKKLPEGDDFPKTSSEKREVKNKYEAIIELEISRQSPLLTNTIQSYVQKVWIAGAVEQCRRLGCLSWFLSSLTRLPYQRESQTPPTANLVEAESWVNLPNLLAQRYSDERAAEAVTQINETTRKELSSIISKGVESGTSYGDIAKEIKTKFEQFAVPKPQQHIPNRAVLVAVTELGNAYCQATLDLADSLQSSGVRMMKAWQTLEDSRVSDGCRHNQDAGWIELDDTFPSGDSRPPRFPGCRCDILTEMLDESMLGRSADDYFDRPDGPERPAFESPAPSWEEWNIEGVGSRTGSRQDNSFINGKVSEIFARYSDRKRLIQDSNKSFRGMSAKLKNALRSYTGDDYYSVNGYFRRKDDTFSRKERELAENVEAAIRKHGVTTRDMVVNRGFNGNSWDEWREGEIREVPECLSSSVWSYGYRGENLVHIYVPANKGCGIYLNSKSKHPEECEYLIAPGSKFYVHHVEVKTNGQGDPVRHFYIELIPEEV